jgi:hypothetical protein
MLGAGESSGASPLNRRDEHKLNKIMCVRANVSLELTDKQHNELSKMHSHSLCLAGVSYGSSNIENSSNLTRPHAPSAQTSDDFEPCL